MCCTWLKPQFDFTIRGYNAVRNDSKHSRGGGTATFIKSGMKFKVEKINTNYESILIKVWTERCCRHYYNLCDKLNQSILEEVMGV